MSRPAVGALAPPLRLLDLETSEPVVLVGLRGKVVWVVFWSADSASAKIQPGGDRIGLELTQGAGTVCDGAGGRRDRSSRPRPCGDRRERRKLPVYLASAETRRRFGADEADPPLNVLIDADGPHRHHRPRNERADDRSDRQPGQKAARRARAIG